MFFAGNESGKWYLDLKNGAGSCGKGEASTDADCTFKMKDEHFQQMFTGKWNIKTYVKSTRQNSDDITTYRKKNPIQFLSNGRLPYSDYWNSMSTILLDSTK